MSDLVVYSSTFMWGIRIIKEILIKYKPTCDDFLFSSDESRQDYNKTL